MTLQKGVVFGSFSLCGVLRFVLEHLPTLVFFVLRNKCRDTGVNMLEKRDLGQWSCVHVSH